MGLEGQIEKSMDYACTVEEKTCNRVNRNGKNTKFMNWVR